MQRREDSPSWLEKEYGKEYPLLISDSDMIKQNGNSSPLPMSTFGKDARETEYHMFRFSREN